ncbi:hypothetical protein [Paraburkholderia antibiotica]|uniref:Uncharacterized protein n=1 Tax=Paraburkholderia antibiotica TaxID=2728839 RepID=A0A7X9ZX98_9BURK|nr:hypothetical protein [Paraburkholderia antibiotica]NML30415.1 hypothetical protein [Paraburkholderia antibiotica]
MDQSNRRVTFRSSDLADVRKILGADGSLDDAEVARRSWRVCEIDDKSIFDKDARRLANALRVENANSFYIVRVCDLIVRTNTLVTYRFEATQDDIEEFQGPSWFEINLDDCLMFNLPFTCAVLRPGEVRTTKFLGNAAFIAKIEQT